MSNNIFTLEDLRLMQTLIAVAPIKGSQSEVVTNLKAKIEMAGQIIVASEAMPGGVPAPIAEKPKKVVEKKVEPTEPIKK